MEVITNGYTFVLKLLKLLKMEYQERLNLWQEIQVRALISTLMERIHQYRRGCSRNTVRLAIQEGPTTPIRQRIIETAQQVLTESINSAKVEQDEQPQKGNMGA